MKYASRDLPGATTTLSLVAKAGTRYQPLPGYSDALEKFAFKVSFHSGVLSAKIVADRLHPAVDPETIGSPHYPRNRASGR